MSRILVDSGIKWIGKYPDEWNLFPLRAVVENINEKNNPIKFTNVLSLTNKMGVVPYEEKGNQGNISKEDISQYKIAYKDTVIINSMNLKIGSVGYSNYDGCVSPVYYVLKNNEKSDIRFINYIFLSSFQKYLSRYGKGILEIREKISMYDVLHSYVPIPSLKTQKKIADYLDEQCTKIDEIINDNNREIELLEEYKRTILKNELGNKVASKKYRIKNIANLKGRIGWQGLTTADYIEEGPYLITGVDFNEIKGSINWETCVHISEERYEEAPEIHVLPNDLLITKDGTIGKLAIISENREASLNSGVMLIRIKDKSVCNVKYLYYLLKSDYFWDWYNSSQRGSSTIKHLYQEQFYNFSFFLPDLAHQEKVIKKIDDQFFKLDQVINYRKQIIEKLEEYKKSLIYEYVTGKREV